MLREYARRCKHRIEFLAFRARSGDKQSFECPICGYVGPFMDVRPATGFRQHAQCPACRALERHRIQFVVVGGIFGDGRMTGARMLHFAPEPFFRDYFASRVGRYETADLDMDGVDHHVDLQQLPFDDASYDLVFASHVLEHVPDDEKAIAEIRRILRPGGMAILPVPIVAEKTVEYPEPNPHEAYHVRAPGLDYFDRYERHFSRVERISSSALPQRYQLHVIERRDHWPTRECPLRPPMPGDRHADIVPVCHV